MRPSSWMPPALWMAMILVLSSGAFSSARTGDVLAVLLAWTAPWLAPGDVGAFHGLVRKLAHLATYAILGLLWFRAFVRDTTLTRGLAAGCAFGISVAWAGVDEFHQHFVPSRSGRIGDVAIDAVGSAVAVGFAHWSGLRAARILGLALLWVAAIGGTAVLATNLASGVSSGLLWLTAPAAALVLAGWYWKWGAPIRPPSPPGSDGWAGRSDLQPGIERVAQPVAEQVDAEHGDENGQPGKRG